MKNSKIIIIYALIFVSFFILILRSFQLQYFNWKEKSIEVQDLNTRMILEKPKRGNIYDRNGVLLAWNEISYRLIHLESLVSKETENKLRSILSRSDVNIEDLIDNLNFHKRANININSTTARQLESINSILVIERYIRKYIHESLYHILGYVDNEGNARSGLELLWDNVLRGKEGYKIVSLHPSGRIKSIVSESPSINGNDIHITIDIKFQKYVYDKFKRINSQGAVIVSDPNTGEILSYVSYPSPDPNAFSRGLSNLEFRRILNDNNRPLIDRVISTKYPPGSVIKPFIAYSVLEGGHDPYEIFESTGRYPLYNSQGEIIATFTDWYTLGHGEVDLPKSLRVSANSYYYNLAEKFGIDYIYQKSVFYNLTGKTGIDLLGEREGLFGSREWKYDNLGIQWYPGETVLSYIGQGYVEMTPIQVLKYYNILATKGNYYQFHLFKKSKNVFGNILEINEPILLESYEMREEYLEAIYEGMYQVTTYSTGGPGRIGTAQQSFSSFPITVAAKTGTAEVSGGRKAHSWFAGFFPMENPEYSITIIVEYGGYGSTAAAPLAREILNYFDK